MSNGIACPICKLNDQIQNIPGIVKRDTTFYEASGPSIGTAFVGGKMGLATGFTRVSGTTQTPLAQLLMPPEWHPTVYSSDPEWFLMMVALIIGSLIIFLGGASVAAAIKGIIEGTVPYKAEIAGLVSVVGVILLLAGIWLLASAYHKYQRFSVRRKADHDRQRHAYEIVMARWGQLYYCYRDDIVFDPVSGKSCPPSQMNSLLF